ncbi:hypothetical protein [Phenylobacterium sp.]|uniref:hypothetical protein n=1 Tax=Phenylobacterium sp. TaxID=1871053 RepID=UPI00286BA641|nr:hypothetical protein [Phenylobacterium sp.]
MAFANTGTNGRYQLHAYVCGVDCVRRYDNLGTVTFTKIYQQRPKNCRYAVAGSWDIAINAERYLVWDLFTTMRKGAHGELITPKPKLQHHDLDAAVMATVLLYGEEDG